MRSQNEKRRVLFLCLCDQVGSSHWAPHTKATHVEMICDQAGDIILVLHENHEFFGLFSHRVDWV